MEQEAGPQIRALAGPRPLAQVGTSQLCGSWAIPWWTDTEQRAGKSKRDLEGLSNVGGLPIPISIPLSILKGLFSHSERWVTKALHAEARWGRSSPLRGHAPPTAHAWSGPFSLLPFSPVLYCMTSSSILIFLPQSSLLPRTVSPLTHVPPWSALSSFQATVPGERVQAGPSGLSASCCVPGSGSASTLRKWLSHQQASPSCTSRASARAPGHIGGIPVGQLSQEAV